MTNALIRRTASIVVAGLAVAALTVSSAGAAESTRAGGTSRAAIAVRASRPTGARTTVQWRG